MKEKQDVLFCLIEFEYTISNSVIHGQLNSSLVMLL